MKAKKVSKIYIFAAVAVFVAALSLTVFAGVDAAYAKSYSHDANPPAITLSPSGEGGFVSSVTVSITWSGENSYKFYSVKSRTGIESGETAYGAPFNITAEGNNEIRAYYYDAEGVKRYVTATVDYVDSTPPPDSAIKESIRCEIDLTSQTPMLLVLRATDALSGIKRIYIKDLGREFYLKDGADSLYAVDCTGLADYVYVVAEDYAGNTCSYGYQLGGYDRTAIRQYSEKFASLSEDSYAGDAWSGILKAYAELSDVLEDPSVSTSVVSAYKRAADDAANTDCKVTAVYTSGGTEIPTGINASVPYGYTNLPAGAAITLTVGECVSPAASETKNTAAAASGYLSPVVYGFSLSLTFNGADVAAYRAVEIGADMPSGADVAKVYYRNSDGVLELLQSEIRDGRLYFYTADFGDFYLVADLEYASGDESGKGLTIGGKFYPADTLWTVGGIIAGAAVLGGVVTVAALLIINKKRGR